MRRREFITLLGGAVAWPLAARAQQPDRMRRIGVLMNGVADRPEGPNFLPSFLQALRKLGWTDGENVRIDYRWSAGSTELARTFAAELAALAPDVILSVSTTNLIAMQQATHTIPIVFIQVSDPVAQGFVPNLAHPGGNLTGFTAFWRQVARSAQAACARDRPGRCHL
jgi:putative ABC transport system substrate-binding protein